MYNIYVTTEINFRGYINIVYAYIYIYIFFLYNIYLNIIYIIFIYFKLYGIYDHDVAEFSF